MGECKPLVVGSLPIELAKRGHKAGSRYFKPIETPVCSAYAHTPRRICLLSWSVV